MSYQPEVRILFNREEIATTVRKLAAEICRDYQDKNPVLLGILKGSFIFLSDLVRQLDFPLEVDFVRLSSYGRGRTSPGKLKIPQGLQASINGRHVLVVEDIIDTGNSLSFLLEYLGKKKPATLRLCTLIDKPSRRETQVKIDYPGLTVPDKFIVGYGIDWDEKFRNLPDIGYIEIPE